MNANNLINSNMICNLQDTPCGNIADCRCLGKAKKYGFLYMCTSTSNKKIDANSGFIEEERKKIQGMGI